MKLISLVVLSILLHSCKISKKYYYTQDDKEEEIIEAATDSAAYLEAHKKFEIAKKVYNDMNETYGRLHSERPIKFKLLNEKREDITYLIHFEKKDSLEKNTSDLVNSLSNPIEERENAIHKSKYDTVGLYMAPIKILNARFIEKEYSNYKDVELRFKNVCKKKVAAIRFKWYGENAFNEPADMGVIDGWGSGFTDDALRPGAVDYGVWNVLSKDGKKILIAYPYEVAFEDGSKWVLGN
ncbi:hypothetical protein GFS24_24895 [Chitinophaga sp. SYP-B3965]|uniref:hypothetical protein n=1 Tax=Chitinophaga sp. SYP-B3965 TaxID=2663120 RepID=UPI001299A89D|nr:hypothetical protein [Chitinophaga sp. SYP-B3965]MRG48377.1 hypothetical protein [Chitinophaga sp. SYP-B3965]